VTVATKHAAMYYYDSTAIRLPFDSRSTAIPPRCDPLTRPTSRPSVYRLLAAALGPK